MSGRVTLDRWWTTGVQQLGLDLGSIAQRAGLHPSRLHAEVSQLTVDEYLALIDQIDIALGDPAAPLRLTMRSQRHAVSPVALAALCSANLERAVERMSAHKRLIAPMRIVGNHGADGYAVTWMWDDPSIRSPRLLAAVELVTMLRIARAGLGERVVPARVTAPVPLGADGPFSAYFGVPVEIGEHTSIRFARQDAERAFPPQGPEVWARFARAIQFHRRVRDESVPFVERTRATLLASLPGGRLELALTARKMGMSPRTLQRRLASEGSSYREVVRATRGHLAVHYLTRTALPYAEIAFLLGFDTSTSFFRAYRDWTGRTPHDTRSSRSLRPDAT